MRLGKASNDRRNVVSRIAWLLDDAPDCHSGFCVREKFSLPVRLAHTVVLQHRRRPRHVFLATQRDLQLPALDERQPDVAPRLEDNVPDQIVEQCA